MLSVSIASEQAEVTPADGRANPVGSTDSRAPNERQEHTQTLLAVSVQIDS